MTHEEAALWVPEYVRDGLCDDLPAGFLPHYESCAECQSLAQMLSPLTGLHRHPSPEELIAHAERDGPSVSDGDPVGLHVSICPDCRSELEQIRISIAAEAALPEWPGAPGPERVIRPERRTPSWGAMAASLAVAALIYPAYIGTFVLLQARTAEGGTWEPTVEISTERFRSASVPPLPEGTTTYTLAVYLGEAVDELQGADGRPEDEYDVSIVSREGRKILRKDRIPGSTLLEQARQRQKLSLSVSTDTVPRGAYHLYVVPRRPRGSEPVVTIEFEIR